tara:strand:- start:230 stop:1075 length:846 start_codon:yes stop_codon:yes gene_type:complete
MFLYLLHNSNLIEDDENKVVKLVIYSILLYIILHLITNSVFKGFPILGYYFWIIFILDSLSLVSILIRENNGQLLINNINNNETHPTNETKRQEITQNTQTLEHLLKETQQIKEMVNEPSGQEAPALESAEFEKFIEDLNNTDLETEKPHQPQQPHQTQQPIPVKNEPPRDERDRLMDNYKKSFENSPQLPESNKEPTLIPTLAPLGGMETFENAIPSQTANQLAPMEQMNTMETRDVMAPLGTMDDMDNLGTLDSANSIQLNNIESDVDMDLNDFDKLIN